MRRDLRGSHALYGGTLVELMIAMVVAVAVLGILTYASMGFSRGISGADQYMTGVANTNRILDAVSQDLRRAVRVGILNGGTITPIKSTGTASFTISASNVLAISVPDYYASNTPNNTAGSNFKSTRYPRSTLNSAATFNSYAATILNGTIPWADAQITVNGKRVTRFAPASAGGRRNADSLLHRAEVGVGFHDLLPPERVRLRCHDADFTREIAARITDSTSTTTLTIGAANNGQVFRLQSSFTPRFRRTAVSPASSTAIVEVSTRNLRRD